MPRPAASSTAVVVAAVAAATAATGRHRVAGAAGKNGAVAWRDGVWADAIFLVGTSSRLRVGLAVRAALPLAPQPAPATAL